MKFKRTDVSNKITSIITLRSKVYAQSVKDYETEQAIAQGAYRAKYGKAWRQFAENIVGAHEADVAVFKNMVPKILFDRYENLVYYVAAPRPKQRDNTALLSALDVINASVGEYLTDADLRSLGINYQHLSAEVLESHKD